MFKFIQKWIDRHATPPAPYPYVYWEVPWEFIFDFLKDRQEEWILYQGNDLEFSKQLILLRKIEEKNKTTFWYISELIIDWKNSKTLCNYGSFEPVYCGRKVFYKHNTNE